MTKALKWVLAGPLLASVNAIGDICSNGHSDEGNCLVDGSGCSGESIEFDHTEFQVLKYDKASNKQTEVPPVSGYAIKGKKDTWQMYLHGPMFRPSERSDAEAIPPVYVSATWTNQIYRFDNFSKPSAGPLKAQQKLVGHALAPSTTFPIEDKAGKLKGLLVAEGQPWWLNRMMFPKEVYKGGVEFLPADRDKKCDLIFPGQGLHRLFGQVVNTVDCHRGTGVCFFTVWKFYDDQKPIWSNHSETVAPDCLYYCLAENLDSDSGPSCSKVGVVYDEHGNKVCHKDGRGAVHGMTIGRSDERDPTTFDIFLVFTGGATFTKGDSSMQKVRVKVDMHGVDGQKDMRVVSSQEFAKDLFVTLMPKGQDAGGDHAWVDDTGKYVWISTFREAAAGVHMVDYETGKLFYSVTGIDSYVPGQYAYSAGIHGVGTIGKKGSYLGIATSACHNVNMCAPMPWQFPIPEKDWAAGVMFILDLGSIKLEKEEAREIVV
eukprot:TRINITY_DN4129_c0_g5_i1.p1 TRINITY_DN4129_c0_g5~~TRINITY_DN4129_c0_g5_i1.p1  ORF type:complete len:488 (+),score=89.40 TRINITY_DN4129_c0_g5_i1:73-1536(+)